MRDFRVSLTEQVILHDFGVLRKRMRKFTRGRGEAFSILNHVTGMINAYGLDPLKTISEERLGTDERKMFNACVKFACSEETGPVDRAFLLCVEEEHGRIRGS